jgi:hypothetical protein
MWKLPLLFVLLEGGTSSEEDDLHVIANLHHGAQCSRDEPQLGDKRRFKFLTLGA